MRTEVARYDLAQDAVAGLLFALAFTVALRVYRRKVAPETFHRTQGGLRCEGRFWGERLARFQSGVDNWSLSPGPMLTDGGRWLGGCRRGGGDDLGRCLWLRLYNCGGWRCWPMGCAHGTVAVRPP